MPWNLWRTSLQVTEALRKFLTSLCRLEILILFLTGMLDTYAEPDCAMEAAMVKVNISRLILLGLFINSTYF